MMPMMGAVAQGPRVGGAMPQNNQSYMQFPQMANPNVPTTSLTPGTGGLGTFNAASPQYYMQQQVQQMISNPSAFANPGAAGPYSFAAQGPNGIAQNLMQAYQQRAGIYGQNLNGWDPNAAAQQYQQQMIQQLQSMPGSAYGGQGSLYDMWTGGAGLGGNNATPNGNMQSPGSMPGAPSGVMGTNPGTGGGAPNNPFQQGQDQFPAMGVGGQLPANPMTAMAAGANPAGQEAAPYGSTQFSGTGTYPGQTPSMGAGGGAPSGTMSPDQWLASSGGSPINATPTWQAMNAAQQKNISEQFTNLNEAMNVSGDRFSTSYGNAASDFWAQTAKNQNANLSQMTYQSLSDAANRQNVNMQQLSSQDFQSMLQQYGLAQQTASQMYGTTTGAGMAASQAQYGAQNAAIMQSPQMQQLWQQYMNLGGTFGGTQYAQQQQGLPQYNPMNAYLAQMMNQYPATAQAAYAPSTFSQIAGPLGSLGAAAISGAVNIWDTIQQQQQAMQFMSNSPSSVVQPY